MNRMISPVRLLDLLQHGLQPVFKLAAKLRAGEHASQVERDHALVAQDLRHVALRDAAGETFDDGCFAHAGLADQHRVVLRAARQHLDHAADLLIAADHRVQLAAPRLLGQVLGVFLERLELALGFWSVTRLRPAHSAAGP